MLKSIPKFRDLRQLVLGVGRTVKSPIIPDFSSFPRLWRFVFNSVHPNSSTRPDHYVPSTNALDGNASLTHVCLPTHFGYAPTAIRLPNLISFTGHNSAFINILACNPPNLRAAKLHDFHDGVLEKLSRFRSFNELSLKTPWSGFRLEDVQPQLTALFHHVPQIQTLALDYEWSFNPSMLPELQPIILEQLRSSRHLQCFGCILRCFPPQIIPSMENQESIVDGWVQHCPTLQECFLKFIGIGRDDTRRSTFVVVDGNVQLANSSQMERVDRLLAMGMDVI
ncbi:hypothetical protein C8J56DRAFT_952227 [Mycena floridula]|nr:hypothetical protein C8J56DRAFT_952227 [Mycena floridula]